MTQATIASLARSTACAASLSLVALLPVPAGATRFDCARPADAFQRSICADPSLSALATEVESYRQEMANIPWRRGLRERHAAAMAALQGGATDAATLRRALTARLAALREENGWSTTAGLEEAPERQLRTTCLRLIPVEDGAAARQRACRVREFSNLGSADGRRYAFALYDYAPDRRGDLPNETAILVFAAAQPGEWTVEIAERLPETTCTRPRLRQGQETLLLLPCAETGTAGGATPQLYRRTGPASFRVWQEIDTQAWQSALQDRLPACTEIRGAVQLDPERMTASFALWRDADPGCCPTGGRGEARLRLDGDRLVLRDLAVR